MRDVGGRKNVVFGIFLFLINQSTICKKEFLRKRKIFLAKDFCPAKLQKNPTVRRFFEKMIENKFGKNSVSAMSQVRMA